MTRDVIGTLVTILKADTDTAALVNARVYAEEVPASEAANMPRSLVMLQHAPGGRQTRDYVEIERITIDLFCFGATPYKAEELRRTVTTALKYINREVSGGVLIHSLVQVGSPQFVRDQDVLWPYMLSTWECLASEKQAS